MRRTTALVVASVAATTLVGFSHQAAGVARPNLTVSKVRIPAHPTVGQNATFKVTVRSTGAPAKASTVRVFLSADRTHDDHDTSLGTVSVTAIPAGESRTVKASLRIPDKPGPRYVVACADAGKAVRESSETDNCKVTATTLWVWPKPEPFDPGTPDPLDVTPELGEESVTEEVGPEGGQIALTAGGDTFTLDIPADALLSPVSITLRPITSIPDLGMSGGLLAGVDVAPHGLVLQQLATLTIAPSEDVEGESLAGFAYLGSGDDLHAVGLDPGNAIVLRLARLGGAGVGSATPADRAAQQLRVPDHMGARWEQRLAPLEDALRTTVGLRARALGEDAADAGSRVLADAAAEARAFIKTVANPFMRVAKAGDTITLGLPSIEYYLGAERKLELIGVPTDNLPEVVAGRKLVDEVYDTTLTKAYDRCSTGHEPKMVPFMLGVERSRQLYGNADGSYSPAEISGCLRFELYFEYDLQGQAWSSEHTTHTAYTYHLKAAPVPFAIDVLEPGALIEASGVHQYVSYTGSSVTQSTYRQDDETVDCTGRAVATSTVDGSFTVHRAIMDLNTYFDLPGDPPPEDWLQLVIEPGGSDGPKDVTTYTADHPRCAVPQGTITNRLWAVAFFLGHAEENVVGDMYRITGFDHGLEGSDILAGKVYSGPVQGNGNPYELTTIAVKHVPLPAPQN